MITTNVQMRPVAGLVRAPFVAVEDAVPQEELMMGAALLNGLIAGAGADRLLVQMPAFRRVGLRGWADFSREADLRTGVFWYPPLAIGGTALSIAAAVTNRSRTARIPTLATAVLAAAGLLVTVKAAPNMLRLKDGNNDPERLRRSFDGFRSWSSLRETFQALAFGASVRALANRPRSRA